MTMDNAMEPEADVTKEAASELTIMFSNVASLLFEQRYDEAYKLSKTYARKFNEIASAPDVKRLTDKEYFAGLEASRQRQKTFYEKTSTAHFRGQYE